MQNNWGSLREDLTETTVNVLWRQWAALGASASAQPALAVVDPEALILTSLAFRAQERRLADAVESWVALNSSLLSIQRFKNLRDNFPPSVARGLSAIAQIGVRQKDTRWKSLLISSDEELGARTNKSRAGRIRFGATGALMLQLRQGMGVSVKADVIAYLLGVWDQGRGWASVSAIAGATGYTAAAVRRSADDLADARFIRSLDTVASNIVAQRMYSAVPGAWNAILQLGGEPLWRGWLPRFAFITHFAAAPALREGSEATEYVRHVAARELIERHRPALSQDGIVSDEAFLDMTDSEALLRHSLRSVRAWMEIAV